MPLAGHVFRADAARLSWVLEPMRLPRLSLRPLSRIASRLILFSATAVISLATFRITAWAGTTSPIRNMATCSIPTSPRG